MTRPENGTREARSAVEPGRPSMADLLRLADAFPLLDRLVLIVTMRAGGDRKTIVFEILDGLQGHLDATVPATGPYNVRELTDEICAWFEERIAEEEAPAGAAR